MSYEFVYDQAFSRNIGWVTPEEQHALRSKKVAIAGAGGVGAVHALTLARLGVGHFNLADFDTYDIPNFNRQVAAMMSTVGQPKVEVVRRMILDINPTAQVTVLGAGVQRDNVDQFLDGCDYYLDSLDFFAFEPRQLVFARCAELGIPATTAAPLGMGTALLNFMPGQMTFEQYFQWGERPELEKAIRFLVGLAPAGLHRPYLVLPSAINLAERRGPSTIMACQLCAGAAATEALKILLKRGQVRAAPRGMQFDAYRNRLALSWRPGGNGHPLQRLAIAIGTRVYGKALAQAMAGGGEGIMSQIDTMVKILDLARWAPSGDNTQPWQFEIVAADHVTIYCHDTRDHCVYDLHGHPSQISHGALLETLDIAASGFGLSTEVSREGDALAPVFQVRLRPDPQRRPSALIASIRQRTVQRRPMQRTPLSEAHKRALEAAVGDGYTIQWLEGPQRRQAALLMYRNARLRLTMPEAFEVHRSIIEWNARHSLDKVPDQALGVDAMTTKLMRWAMHSWPRMKAVNTLLGTWAPRLQMDLLPGLACAAHYVIKARRAPEGVDDYVAAGRAVQRFWLTVTSLGLLMQPEMTPLIFTSYLRQGIRFSALPEMERDARRLEGRIASLIETDANTPVYMGRLGHGPQPHARSLRQPLGDLLR